MPVHIVSADETLLYVTMPQLDQIGVFDIGKGEWLSSIRVPSYPGYMRFLRDRNLLITANYNDESLTIIDLASRQVSCIPTGRYPRYFAISDDARTIAAVNFHVGTVSLVSLAGKKPMELGVVKVGPRPVSACFVSSGDSALVLDQEDGGLRSVDTLSASVVRTLSLSQRGRSIIASPCTNEAYITVPKTDKLLVVDYAGNLICSIGVGQGPIFHRMLSDGARLFTVNGRGGSVSFIDTRKRALNVTVAVGPLPITAFEVPGSPLLLVIVRGGNSITLVDTDTYSVVGSVGIGNNAYWAAFLRNPATAFITNEGEPSISVVRLKVS